MAMRLHSSILVLVGVSIVVSARGQEESNQGLLVDYYPAVCHPALYPAPGCSLTVFQRHQLRTPVELPLRLELFSYANRGNAIYELSVLKRPVCFYRVDLSPVRVESLGCREDVSSAFDLAISGNEHFMLVSGNIKREPAYGCGIFEFRLPALEIRQVLDAGDCRSYGFENAWTSLSLSPDGRQAVAVRQDRLELIDVVRGTRQTLAHGVVKAAWSPDGRWIAALNAHGETQLMRTNDYKVGRTLAGSEVQWSPDSRYLIRVRPCSVPVASNGVGTIEALDVTTGKSVEIGSSKCAIDNHSTGWVSADVLK